MKDFFSKVEQIKRNMDQIKKNMVGLEKKHGASLTAISSSKSKREQDEIEDLMDQTTTLIKAVKEALKDNSKQTVDYISDINKHIKDQKDINELKQPHLTDLPQCLTELTQTVHTYSRI